MHENHCNVSLTFAFVLLGLGTALAAQDPPPAATMPQDPPPVTAQDPTPAPQEPAKEEKKPTKIEENGLHFGLGDFTLAQGGGEKRAADGIRMVGDFGEFDKEGAAVRFTFDLSDDDLLREDGNRTSGMLGFEMFPAFAFTSRKTLEGRVRLGLPLRGNVLYDGNDETVWLGFGAQAEAGLRWHLIGAADDPGLALFGRARFGRGVTAVFADTRVVDDEFFGEVNNSGWELGVQWTIGKVSLQFAYGESQTNYVTRGTVDVPDTEFGFDGFYVSMGTIF